MDRPEDDTVDDDDYWESGMDDDEPASVHSSWRAMLADLRSSRDLYCEPGDDTTIEIHVEPCEGPPNCTCEPMTVSAWDDAGIEAALRAMDVEN